MKASEWAAFAARHSGGAARTKKPAASPLWLVLLPPLLSLGGAMTTLAGWACSKVSLKLTERSDTMAPGSNATDGSG